MFGSDKLNLQIAVPGKYKATPRPFWVLRNGTVALTSSSSQGTNASPNLMGLGGQAPQAESSLRSGSEQVSAALRMTVENLWKGQLASHLCARRDGGTWGSGVSCLKFATRSAALSCNLLWSFAPLDSRGWLSPRLLWRCGFSQARAPAPHGSPVQRVGTGRRRWLALEFLPAHIETAGPSTSHDDWRCQSSCSARDDEF